MPVSQTQLALVTAAGTSALTSFGWQWSPFVRPLCRAAVGLLEEALSRHRANESHCDCAAEERVGQQLQEALRVHGSAAPEAPVSFEGPVRRVIYDLAVGGPWLLEAALVVAVWLLLSARSCVGRLLQVLCPNEPRPAPLRAVRRRVSSSRAIA